MTPDTNTDAQAEQIIEAIPDELLPAGVSGASWDPDLLRLAAEAHCRHDFDHDITVKAWVVLHLLNERERARAADQLEAAPDAIEGLLELIAIVCDEDYWRMDDRVRAAQEVLAALAHDTERPT